jgi:hypothetical protein
MNYDEKHKKKKGEVRVVMTGGKPKPLVIGQEYEFHLKPGVTPTLAVDEGGFVRKMLVGGFKCNCPQPECKTCQGEAAWQIGDFWVCEACVECYKNDPHYHVRGWDCDVPIPTAKTTKEEEKQAL